jgi:hypothetical protein
MLGPRPAPPGPRDLGGRCLVRHAEQLVRIRLWLAMLWPGHTGHLPSAPVHLEAAVSATFSMRQEKI